MVCEQRGRRGRRGGAIQVQIFHVRDRVALIFSLLALVRIGNALICSLFALVVPILATATATATIAASVLRHVEKGMEV